MKTKGIFEFEIEGRHRGFKFGTYAFAVACEEDNCTLDELFKRIGVGQGKPKVNLLALLNTFYGAAVAYAKGKKQDVDFAVDDVSDWLDHLGVDKVYATLSDGLTQYVPKNSPPPMETGEKVIQ
jgi:hypothetical protein